MIDEPNWLSVYLTDLIWSQLCGSLVKCHCTALIDEEPINRRCFHTLSQWSVCVHFKCRVDTEHGQVYVFISIQRIQFNALKSALIIAHYIEALSWMKSHSVLLLYYLPPRITRPLVGSKGGDYCLDLSSALHVSSFTSFHLYLNEILMEIGITAISVWVRNGFTFGFCPCVISQCLNALTFVTVQIKKDRISYQVSASCL